jgi:hypothetical protein
MRVIASYNAAVAAKIAPPQGTLRRCCSYQASETYRGLAPRTREDYAGHIKRSRRPRRFPASAPPTCALAAFPGWRDKLRLHRGGRPITRYRCWRAFCLGHRSRPRLANPREAGPPHRGGCRVDKVVSEDEDRFLASAPSGCICLSCCPFGLASDRGFAGFLGRLRRQTIRLGRQDRVRVISMRCAAEGGSGCGSQGETRPRSLSARGTALTRDGFKSAWRLACKDAGVSGTYHDLRALPSRACPGWLHRGRDRHH